MYLHFGLLTALDNWNRLAGVDPVLTECPFKFLIGLTKNTTLPPLAGPDSDPICHQSVNSKNYCIFARIYFFRSKNTQVDELCTGHP